MMTSLSAKEKKEKINNFLINHIKIVIKASFQPETGRILYYYKDEENQ